MGGTSLLEDVRALTFPETTAGHIAEVRVLLQAIPYSYPVHPTV